MTQNSISLEANDAAIILRSDGSFETSLPQIDSDHIPENAMMGAALAYALQNPDICEVILRNFYITSNQLDHEDDKVEPLPVANQRRFTPTVVG